MAFTLKIVPIIPFEDGVAVARDLDRQAVQDEIRALLEGAYVRDTLGAMSRQALSRQIMQRLQTPLDYSRFPELEDLYGERLDYLRGFAKGAECSLSESALFDYLKYREWIDNWYHPLNPTVEPGHCSGVLLVGPDGVLGAHNVESSANVPRPRGYRHRSPPPYRGLKSVVKNQTRIEVDRPRTGYIQHCGVMNEMGLAMCCGNSCSTWLDEPIEDTWPILHFPLLRFAKNVAHLVDLYSRYTLYAWGRASQIWADTSGDGVVIEKSFRRVGFRRLKDHALWCTEGHFESPEMNAYLRSNRLEYLERLGKPLGSEDMQYAADAAVRFTRLAELCHENWGRGYDHMRRVLTDHAPFPRATCRHAGPDTAAYDTSITQQSRFRDLTHNRFVMRKWIPWQRFCCEVPEQVTQFPPLPDIVKAARSRKAKPITNVRRPYAQSALAEPPTQRFPHV